jgi:hypothetical protein
MGHAPSPCRGLRRRSAGSTRRALCHPNPSRPPRRRLASCPSRRSRANTGESRRVVGGVVFVSWRTAGGVASSQGGCAACAVWREARGESDQ